MSRAQVKNRDSGFTLVEVLVVLVIVAMITLLLTQALSTVFALRLRLAPYLDRIGQTALIDDWLHGVLGAVVTDAQDGKNIFRGTSTSIEGLTLAPLNAKAGLRTPFLLELKSRANGKMSLTFATADTAAIDFLTWNRDDPGASEAGFAYFDGTNWSTQWPLASAPTQLDLSTNSFGKPAPAQLPKLIKIQVLVASQKWVILAHPKAADRPLAQVLRPF
jgi:general secretion pathway protein J